MELFKLTEVEKILQDLAKDVKENYKEKLLQSNRYTQERSLLNSVETKVKVNGTEYEVVMTLNDYWKYVENDTKPHFPPPSAILRWVKIKPVLPRPMKNGKLPTPSQLAFLIGRKIAQVGTKGSHDLERTKDAILPFYKDELETALGHDVQIYIEKVLQG